MKNKKRSYTPEDIVTYKYRTNGQIKSYDKISLVRSIFGGVLLCSGVVTIPLPTGSILFIGVGCWLLGYDSKAIIKKIRYKLKLLSDWVYCNRTPKRIIKTIKMRYLIW